jgi:hypothetical protein
MKFSKNTLLTLLDLRRWRPLAMGKPSTATSLLFIATVAPLAAQKPKKNDPETAAVKAVVNRFFEGMEKRDTALLKSTCAPEMLLQTFMADKNGKMQVYSEPLEDFVNMVAFPSSDKYVERIRFEAVNVEKSLASVWAPYQFFINDKRSHCGTNSFQLIKTSEGWKIQYIIYTRRKEGCRGG